MRRANADVLAKRLSSTILGHNGPTAASARITATPIPKPVIARGASHLVADVLARYDIRVHLETDAQHSASLTSRFAGNKVSPGTRNPCETLSILLSPAVQIGSHQVRSFYSALVRPGGSSCRV